MTWLQRPDTVTEFDVNLPISSFYPNDELNWYLFINSYCLIFTGIYLNFYF